MSNPIYYCHQCNREVRSRESDLKCADCGGEFIEEVERERPFQLHFASNPAPQLDRPRSAASRPRPYPQDYSRNQPSQQPPQAMAFGPLNSLLSMLVSGGRPSQAPQPQSSQPRLRPRGETTFVLNGRPPRPPPNPADPHQQAHNHAVHAHAVHPQMQDSVTQFFTQLVSGLGTDQANLRFHLSVGGDVPDGEAPPPIFFNFADFEQMQLDQIVTNLLNSFENTNGAAGLPPEDVARIPRVKVNQKHVDNDTQCTTCMESFKKDETVLELNCRHIFHQDCLVPWFDRHRTCPICRQEVDPSTFPNATSQSTQPSAPSAPAAHANPQQDMDLD